MITREKKKTGEKLLRIVRSGRASPQPPAAAAAAAAALTSPHQLAFHVQLLHSWVLWGRWLAAVLLNLHKVSEIEVP